MRFIKKNFYLILIIILATFLRFWQLGLIPPSPDWDEAALGYNALSILKTGKDEYGTSFPVALRSFDDYKPPLYMYLTVPSVWLFGLNNQSVRSPGAISGILAVLGAYFMVFELTKTSGSKNLKKSKIISLTASFLLVISPWHIQFSRIAFEAGIGVTLNIWGVYLFLRGLTQKNYLVMSAFIFGLSLYAYHSERIFVPFLVLILAVLYKKKLISNKRKVLQAVAVGFITIIPLIGLFTDKNTLMRLRGTSSLSDQTGLLAASVNKLEDDIKRGDYIGKILDNRRVVWTKTLLSGYLSHFSLKWWFISGDNPRHHASDVGMLHLWELPFLFIGIYAVFKKKNKLTTVLFSWFLLSPVAASPTTELPHGIRTLVFLPTFQVFIAFGLWEVFKYVKFNKTLIVKVSTILYSIFVIGNIFYYFHMYYIHSPIDYSQYWQYGYKQAVAYAETNYDKYEKIVVSTKLEQPHMFFLYYLKYDPVKYLSEGGTASGGFREVENKFDKYEFRPIVWDQENKDGSTLYIATPEEINTSPLKTIYYLDKKEAIRIAR
ncbi:ArnT family glycosyltransferase [Patescibacteria group bacterium]